MQFQIFFYESQVEENHLQKKKKIFFFAVLLHFYDPKYLNLTKSRLFYQKSGMVPKVTLILNSKMYIVTKFQVLIFKNYKVRRGGYVE